MGDSAMRKHILLTIFFALLCIGAGRMWDYGDLDLYGEGSLKFVDQIESKASVTCSSLTASAINDDDESIGYGDDDYYRGWIFLDAAAAHNICRMDINLTWKAGDISGYTYYAQVWSLTGDDLNAQQGSDSAGVTGNNGWSDTSVTFTWGTSITLAQNTSYAIVFTRKGWNNSNYAAIMQDLDANTMNYCSGTARWASAKNRTAITAIADPKGTLYSDQ
jgi:hypothetical protein